VLQLYDALRASPLATSLPCPLGLTNLAWSAQSGRIAWVQPDPERGTNQNIAVVWDPESAAPPQPLALVGEHI
jgi:hypothetical protein